MLIVGPEWEGQAFSSFIHDLVAQEVHGWMLMLQAVKL